MREAATVASAAASTAKRGGGVQTQTSTSAQHCQSVCTFCVQASQTVRVQPRLCSHFSSLHCPAWLCCRPVLPNGAAVSRLQQPRVKAPAAGQRSGHSHSSSAPAPAQHSAGVPGCNAGCGADRAHTGKQGMQTPSRGISCRSSAFIQTLQPVELLVIGVPCSCRYMGAFLLLGSCTRP